MTVNRKGKDNFFIHLPSLTQSVLDNHQVVKVHQQFDQAVLGLFQLHVPFVHPTIQTITKTHLLNKYMVLNKSAKTQIGY